MTSGRCVGIWSNRAQANAANSLGSRQEIRPTFTLLTSRFPIFRGLIFGPLNVRSAFGLHLPPLGKSSPKRRHAFLFAVFEVSRRSSGLGRIRKNFRGVQRGKCVLWTLQLCRADGSVFRD